MPARKSQVLEEHFKKQNHNLGHLEYLDKILSHIHPIHMERVLEMRNQIELTLLSNPESKNEVVAYLSGVHQSLQYISETAAEKIQQEVYHYA